MSTTTIIRRVAWTTAALGWAGGVIALLVCIGIGARPHPLSVFLTLIGVLMVTCTAAGIQSVPDAEAIAARAYLAGRQDALDDDTGGVRPLRRG